MTNSDALDSYEDSNEQQINVDSHINFLIGSSNLITLGVDGAWHLLASPRLRNDRGQRVRGAVFAQDEIHLGDAEQIIVLPAIRLDLDSQFGVYPTPRLAARWRVYDRINIRASVGRGYKAPTFQDMLLDFENPSAGYVIEGNENLRPEQSLSTQFGANWIMASWLEFDANLYWNELSDLIASTSLPSTGLGEPQRFGYRNIEEAYTRGVETSIRIKPTKRVSLDFAYTLTDAWDKTQNRALQGRSPHHYNVHLGATDLPLNFNASTQFSYTTSRPFYMSGINTLDQTEYSPAYIYWNAHLSRPIGDYLSVFANAKNILNAGDSTYYPHPPRTLFIGIRGHYE